MARDKKSENPISRLLCQRSHTQSYLGLATPGILHGIIVTKKAVTRLSVIFPFIKHVLIRLERYQDLEKWRREKAQAVINPTNSQLSLSNAQY